MQQSSTQSMPQFTPCASLAALGSYLQPLKLFEPIREQVRIKQKTLIHTPIDKLYDAWIAILAGAHGIVEVNTRLRSDAVLQQAFGRSSCADQSTIQSTLNACTTDNVQQLCDALTTIYRQHSQGYRHNYARHWQILDVDMTGAPCGRKAALATKGYFANQRKRRGRQVGRVLASLYREVVVDQLFAGTAQLTTALHPLLQAAEQVLELDAAKRARTIVRLDAGGGSLDDVNWLLARGYQLHTKDFSTVRATRLAASVREWFDDPDIPGRQVGWVETPANDYVREVRRIAVRWRKKNGQWGIAVLISTLRPRTVIEQTEQPLAQVLNHQAVLLAYVHFYDQRGGGVESAIKDDKQGLGMTKRNKKRFEAQQMLMMLGMLAHNVIVWATRWLAPHEPKLRRYGVKRMVRDILHISGRIVRNAQGRIVQIILNQAAPLVRGVARSLDVLLRPTHIAVNWGQT
jgi:Transposase DDE domain group 1